MDPNQDSHKSSNQIDSSKKDEPESGESQLFQDPHDEVAYIGEFQNEYINQEIYNLFEIEGKVIRGDLYTCARAMGGWTPEECENKILTFCSGRSSWRTRPQPRWGCHGRWILADTEVHPAAIKAKDDTSPAVKFQGWIIVS